MKKKFNVGDKVAELADIEKRAAGMSPSPLFQCSEIAEVVEIREGYRYRFSNHGVYYKETQLVHEKDIVKVALYFLTNKIEDVINAVQGGD